MRCKDKVSKSVTAKKYPKCGGGLGESTDGLIRKAAEQRANRLTHAEFEREATWATRKFVPFVMQRISVAVQIAAATEIRQALGRGMGPDSA